MSIYDLPKAKAEVQERFNNLEAIRKRIVESAAALQQQLNQVVTELARCQGEFRMLERLEKEGGQNGQEKTLVPVPAEAQPNP